MSQDKGKAPVIEITPELEYTVVVPCKCGKGKVTYRHYKVHQEDSSTWFALDGISCPECEKQYFVPANAPVIEFEFEPEPDDAADINDDVLAGTLKVSYHQPNPTK